VVSAAGRAAGGEGGGLGCGSLVFEPAGETTSENWVHVGNGQGAYQTVSQLQYVGQGGDYDREKVVEYSSWRVRTCCIVLLIFFVLAGIGAVVWLVIPQQKLSPEREETQQAATSIPFDCEAAYGNWTAAWSVEKKHWCCDYKDRGCETTTSLPYDCAAGFSNWQKGWSDSKKQWCCQHASKGCHVEIVTSKPYDCAIGLSSWESSWSPGKKLWCCGREKLGCPATKPFDCDAGLSNWENVWSAAKKAWCCKNEGKGCVTTTKVTTTLLPSTTVAVQRKSCSLWGDPHIFTFDRSRLVFYSEGDFWIVKTPTLRIQGRFQATDWTKKNDHTDYSSMTGIIVSGSCIKDRKIEVGAMGSGKISCDGESVLSEYGTANCGGVTLTYDKTGKLVDSAMAFLPHRVVHIALPNNVDMQVNRWPNFINAQIIMGPMDQQTGICGDFNGVPKDGVQAGKALHAKFGLGVPEHELLFASSIPLHIPTALPNAKRCSPSKKAKASAICHREAQGAVGWSEAECLGDVCDPHTTQLTSITANEMQAKSP
jgi:hypothetical protein